MKSLLLKSAFAGIALGLASLIQILIMRDLIGIPSEYDAVKVAFWCGAAFWISRQAV